MFNISKQTRSTILLILALAIVPVTIDACNSGGGGSKAKDNFEIVTLLCLGGAMVTLGRRKKPAAPMQAV